MAEELEEIRQPGRAPSSFPVADDAAGTADLGHRAVVHQWLPAAHRGDAVGDNARVMRDLFRQWGHSSEIYALTIDGDLESEIRPGRTAGQGRRSHLHSPCHRRCRRRSPQHCLAFACSTTTTSRRLTSPRLRCRHLPDGCRGRRELAMLADRTDIALGVSDTAPAELVDAGFDQTGVPLVVDTARLTKGLAESRRWNPCCRMDWPTSCSWARRAEQEIEDHIRLAEQHSVTWTSITVSFLSATTTPCRPTTRWCAPS